MSEQPVETDIARAWRQSRGDHEEFARLLRAAHQPPEGHPERSSGDEDERG